MTRSYCDCLCPMCIGQGKGSEGGRRYYPTEECASNARAIQMVTRHRCGLRIHFQDHASNIGSNTNRFFLQPATFPCPFPMDKHILAHPSYRQQPVPILSACFCPESLCLCGLTSFCPESLSVDSLPLHRFFRPVRDLEGRSFFRTFFRLALCALAKKSLHSASRIVSSVRASDGPILTRSSLKLSVLEPIA